MSYPNLAPLGLLTVTTAGTPVLLSTNCGAQSGGVGGTQTSPPKFGRAFRQIQLTCPISNSGFVYLLPRGKTASGNPEAIMAAIAPGETQPFPYGESVSSGLVPENLVLDADTSGSVVYGCAFRG